MKLILFFLVFLNSCSKTAILEENSKNINGADFYQALGSGYNQLSQREKTLYDWMDADHFAQKGLNALNFRYVGADNPLNREIPDKFTLEELILAYNKLNQIIMPDWVKFELPLKSARLQILFDYWLEQAEENWQNKEIYRYREEFWDSYRTLNSAILLLKAKKLEKKNIDPNYHIIFFDHNSDKIDQSATITLNNIAEYLRKLYGNYKIILEGHTDLSGNSSYNKELSERRIKSVKNALIAKGAIPESFVKEQNYSDQKPKVSINAGGKLERLNRRVEIYIIKQN